MAAKHDALAQLAREKKMTDDERAEQLVNLVHGNLPEELICSSEELTRRVGEVMRSKGGWDGDIATFFPAAREFPRTE